jgi:predicted nucleic acid-binding protein
LKRAFVDTGAWYSLLDKNDPDHVRVTETFRAYRGRLVTTNFVFDEAVTLARYRLGWSVAQTFGSQLREQRIARLERVTPKDEIAAWSIFERYRDKRFSFTDCTSFVLIDRLALPVCLATDSDFRSFGLQCLPSLD